MTLFPILVIIFISFESICFEIINKNIIPKKKIFFFIYLFSTLSVFDEPKGINVILKNRFSLGSKELLV